MVKFEPVPSKTEPAATATQFKQVKLVPDNGVGNVKSTFLEAPEPPTIEAAEGVCPLMVKPAAVAELRLLLPAANVTSTLVSEVAFALLKFGGLKVMVLSVLVLAAFTLRAGD